MPEPRRPVVLVTGGAGAIGSALGRVLQSDYTIVVLDRVESDTADDALVCDLTSDDSVELAFRKLRDRHGDRIDSVVHLAAYFDFTGEEHPLYEALNVKGTRRLLRALREFDVGQFVFSGTMLVHAPGAPGERIDESAPIEPAWIYPQSKAAAEDVIREERGDIPTVLLHLAGMYDERSCVPTLAHQIARVYERDVKSHLYAGSLLVGQSLLHRDDMIDAFRRTIERRAELPELTTILIGEEDAVGYGALQDEIGRLIHGEEEWATITVPKPVAKAGAWAEETLEPVIPDAIDQGEKPFIRPFMIEMADDHYALDITRARELLDWSPRHNILEELPKLISALKDDPKSWFEANGVTPPPWMETAARRGDDPDDLRDRFEAENRAEHRRFLWAPFFTIAAGSWLIVAPATLGYQSALMTWSDIVSGAVIMVLSLLSLSWRLAPARWATALVGVWLLIAPLLFWAPTAAAYLNGTLVGALVVGFSALARPAPGVSPVAALTGPTVPPGWSASPSSWHQRLPIIILAFVGLYISRYLGAYQLGHIDTMWDPFFTGGPEAATGTEQVITSDVSEAFPVSDAALGGVVYMLEILLGVIGGTRRWRTMPWVVASFGFLIVPLGIVSITFIIIQPIIIGTWCALCLIAALAMLLQIAYSFNELVATGQFLYRRKKAGQPLLRVFFVGDTDEGETKPEEDDFERPPQVILRDMLTEGVGLPWNLLVCILVGLWLMFTRMTLGVDGAMADADHLIGSLVITVSIIACAEAARAVRYLNIVLGLALLVTPFAFGAGMAAVLASIVAGLLLVAASLRRGPVRSRYGSWEAVIV